MFVLSYFRTDPEALHLAVSDDGYAWRALNDNEPVLRGEVGAESLRDPFLLRDRDGTFHLLATNGWESDHVVHATSPDLLTWSDQELLGVMADVPGTKNCWAPEAYYDREADVYRLVWSSTVRPERASRRDRGPSDESEYDHRIWSCATRDFESFGPSACSIDPGYNVIDATVAYDEATGEYLVAIKDERGETSADAEHKDVRIARAPTGGGPFLPFSEPVTPSPVEGPTLFRTDDEWLLLYDHFLDDHYGASRSEDGETWETCADEMTFPEDVRHGSVLEVPDALGEELTAADAD